jgi:uncharacterized RmlC-like cupin family protein
MVPFDKQTVTVVRQSKIGVDTSYEPPLRVGFGISDKTIDGAEAVMGRTVLVPGAGPNPTHFHANNDVCWYIMSGRIRCIQARSDLSDRKEIILEAGDFVYIPSGAVHVIANASQTEEASLISAISACRTWKRPAMSGSPRNTTPSWRRGLERMPMETT